MEKDIFDLALTSTKTGETLHVDRGTVRINITCVPTAQFALTVDRTSELFRVLSAYKPTLRARLRWWFRKAWRRFEAWRSDAKSN